jgi:monomeric sarcosine oxidase
VAFLDSAVRGERALTRAMVAPPPTGADFDIVVLGGGTIGLAAAYYAARAGYRTLLLEQFDLGNAFGGSGGFSRMFRVMYAPGSMARLAEIALALWDEIESVSAGSRLLDREALIFYGSPSRFETPEGDLPATARTMAGLGIPFEQRDGASLMQAFPAFKNIPADYLGLVQRTSAVIRAASSLLAFDTLATRAGATVLDHQPATITTPTPTGPYRVSCPAGTYVARRLILCPGAWANQALLPFRLQLNLSIWQMTVAYFPADTTRYAYPLWYEFGAAEPGNQGLFYGFPPDEHPGTIKVSADFTNTIYTSPEQCTYKPDPALLALLQRFLVQRFNGVRATPEHAATCLYTMSSDGQMILDRLPGFASIAIFAGDSGRAFKFTPLFGRILVELATSGSTDYAIKPFSITRPGIVK